ncbi:ankyrin repeat-containing domain protein [Lactarius akahatsu]|uniref:Ankyrin repeat-containing domain protein n=1 Tax=Lactarius akahatsu TaxID=416441 RepID=A0AAD4LBE6_9AGAM|nr:ankyrin repeat-containing domain protein [Lactarius akahatsu]
MEVHWLPLVDPWKAGHPSSPRATGDSFGFPTIMKVDNKWTSPSAFKVQMCILSVGHAATLLPPNFRQFLNELYETLNETYERILRGINKTQQDNAHRLLHCPAVAIRPLRVEELAELLAFDFQASNSGIPKSKDDWRWENHEEAVLSTCSSLIAIVPSRGSRVVQFSHFSVKEYLTSLRLTWSHEDVSKFHIDHNVAHTILAQACPGTLLRLDEHADAKGFPLVKYAAKHWIDHARFEKVSSRVRNGMDDLFDSHKPHFAAWLQVHNVDKASYCFSTDSLQGVCSESPLYYAAFCGFYDLADRLIIMMKRPEQVNQGGGCLLPPLLAALFQGHFGIANSLRRYGADVNVRGDEKRTPLYTASISGRVDIMRWLLNHGADPNAPRNATYTNLEAVQVLLEYNADANSRGDDGKTPLHDTIFRNFGDNTEGKTVDVVRRLLEHGADPNACDHSQALGQATPLHEASSKGLLEVARVLLSYRVNVDERDGKGKTPFQTRPTVL